MARHGDERMRALLMAPLAQINGAGMLPQRKARLRCRFDNFRREICHRDR